MQSRKGEDGGVTGLDGAAELGSHGALVADHVGPSAAKACRTHCFVGIHHDVVAGSLSDGVVVVVDGGLRVVVVAVGNDLSDVAGLHCVVAILVHERIGLLHPTFIVQR